jgi:metacaspase-1
MFLPLRRHNRSPDRAALLRDAARWMSVSSRSSASSASSPSVSSSASAGVAMPSHAPPSPVAGVQALPATHLSPAARALARGGAPGGLSPAALALSLSRAADTRCLNGWRSADETWPKYHRELRTAESPAQCSHCSQPPAPGRPAGCPGQPQPTIDQPFSETEHPRKRYRALLIGIGYRDHYILEHLHGAVTDVQEMYSLVTEHIGYHRQDVRVLSDEPLIGSGTVHAESPTKANIFAAMTWLVEGASAGDSCFFFFAGHGHHMPDVNGDEISGMDQVLYPVDLISAGCILDDHIYERLVRGVPPGVRLTAVVDACKSGTVLDLPFLYQYPEVLAEAGEAWSAAPREHAASRRCVGADPESESQVAQTGGRARALMTTEGEVPRYRKRIGQGVGEVVLFSGSADSQNATDAPVDGQEAVSMGVFTRIFICELKQVLASNNSLTYGALLDKVKDSVVERVGEIWEGYARQVPQMSSSYPFDIYNTPFSI